LEIKLNQVASVACVRFCEQPYTFIPATAVPAWKSAGVIKYLMAGRPITTPGLFDE